VELLIVVTVPGVLAVVVVMFSQGAKAGKRRQDWLEASENCAMRLRSRRRSGMEKLGRHTPTAGVLAA